MQEAYNLDATTAHALAARGRAARASTAGACCCAACAPACTAPSSALACLPRIGEDALFPAERELLASTRHAIAYADRLVAHAALSASSP